MDKQTQAFAGRTRLSKRPVILFFVLAFALSWGLVLLVVVPGGIEEIGWTSLALRRLLVGHPVLVALLLLAIGWFLATRTDPQPASA